METWLLYSFLAFFMWGIWGFLPKVALTQVTPQSALIWQGIASGIATIILYLYASPPMYKGALSAAAGLGIGFFAFMGSVFFIFALASGKTSVVIMVTSLYPLISIFLTVIFLGEALTWHNLLGIFFGALALFFLVH